MRWCVLCLQVGTASSAVLNPVLQSLCFDHSQGATGMVCVRLVEAMDKLNWYTRPSSLMTSACHKGQKCFKAVIQ